jgi:hypothetical protein
MAIRQDSPFFASFFGEAKKEGPLQAQRPS